MFLSTIFKNKYTIFILLKRDKKLTFIKLI